MATQIQERKQAVILAQHQPLEPNIYGLREGYDADVECPCGFVTFGIGRTREQAEYVARRSVANHLRVVLEHAARCPQDVAVPA